MKEVFINTPAAAAVVADSLLGELRIGGADRSEGVTVPYGSGITWECDVVCASPCQRSEETITFPTVDFGNCSSCVKTIGMMIRHYRMNYGPGLQGLNDLPPFTYQGTGVVSGTIIATNIYNHVQAYLAMHRQDSLHGIEVTQSGDTLTIKTTCPLVFPTPQGVFAHSENLSVAEAAAFTTTVVQTGIPASNTLAQIRTLYGYAQLPQSVAGTDLNAAFFESCENPCIITLKTCMNSCAVPSLPDMGIARQGYMMNQTIVLIVNASAAGYAAWLGAINTALGTSCNAAIQPAVNGMRLRARSVSVSSGSATLDYVTPASLQATSFSGLLKTTLSNNASTPLAVDVYHTQAEYTAAALHTKFVAAGVVALAAEGDNLTVSGAAAAGATSVSLTTIIP